jgi:hypothetical protein
LSLPLCVF